MNFEEILQNEMLWKRIWLKEFRGDKGEYKKYCLDL